MIAVMDINDSLELALSGLNPSRSKFQAAGYVADRYDPASLIAAYEGSSLISRVVDIPVEDAFREWREWQGDADQITAIEAVENTLDIKRKMSYGLSDARLLGNGYLFIDNGEDTQEELIPDQAEPLRYVVHIDNMRISEGQHDHDPLSPYYGRPLTYRLMGGVGGMLDVHPSRIVHYTGRKSRGGNYGGRLGQSVIASMLDDLKAVDAVMLNVADMTMEAKVDVMKIKNLFEMVQSPEELEQIQKKLRLAMFSKSTNGALILDQEREEWEQKTINFSTLPDIIDSFQIAASGAAQIPRSRLFGVQTGGLGNAGESDTRIYYDRIRSMQETEVQPASHILDQMIIKTALGNIPPEVHFNWRSLHQVNPKEKAEIGEKIVKKYADAVNAGIFAPEFATEPMINELTEAGVSPGLEGAYSEWIGSID